MFKKKYCALNVPNMDKIKKKKIDNYFDLLIYVKNHIL